MSEIMSAILSTIFSDPDSHRSDKDIVADLVLDRHLSGPRLEPGELLDMLELVAPRLLRRVLTSARLNAPPYVDELAQLIQRR